MTENFDGRAELRIFYTTTIASRPLVHTHTIDIGDGSLLTLEPGFDFTEVLLTAHNTDDILLSQMVDDYIEVILPMYTTGTEFNRAEVWKYGEEPSTEATYLSTYEIGLPGTGAGAADNPAQQTTFTFRTLNGGVMRGQLMENRHTAKTYETAPFSLPEFTAYSGYLINTVHCYVGRDNTRPFARIGLGHGQNEKLGRKRHRE